MSVFEIIYIVMVGLCMLFAALMLIKSEVTCKNHLIINYAIYLYSIDSIDKSFECEVDWDDMEGYEKTLWRLWDWGYTRILSPEKFEIIKPYIEKAKGDIKNESTI